MDQSARERLGGRISRFDELIRPDRVHGSLYTDPSIFAQELERIWYRTWVYVGHTSEVPQPNDYVLKSIGPQPVIMTRDRRGEGHPPVNPRAPPADLGCGAARGAPGAVRWPHPAGG